MRTIVYVDGFNLYFRLLQKRPALKWLNIKALAERLLKPTNQIVAVRYYTARVALPQPWPDVVKALKVEEKGSDVNLACHLLLDAFQNKYDVAAVLSNDSDLVEPIRIVTQELGKPLGLLSPVSAPNPELSRVASFIRRISVSDLAAAQFSSPLPRAGQLDLIRPAAWV